MEFDIETVSGPFTTYDPARKIDYAELERRIVAEYAKSQQVAQTVEDWKIALPINDPNIFDDPADELTPETSAELLVELVYQKLDEHRDLLRQIKAQGLTPELLEKLETLL